MKEMVGGCCVCSDERGWAENPLVYCDGHGCNVAVHQACYGIVQVPTGPWFCRKCESQERAARVRCELCPHKDGALKRTDNGGWAHVVCALYIPEVQFANVLTMEPIVLQYVPHDRFNKTCYICEEQGRESKAASGACMACNRHGCRQAFHVTCLAEAAYEAADVADDQEEPATYCLSSSFELIVQKLLETADRPDGHQNNLRSSAYESLMEIVKNSAKDCYPAVQKTTLVIMERLQQVLQMESHIQSTSDRIQFNDLQSLLCATLQNVLRKVQHQDALQISDVVMASLLRMFQSTAGSGGVQEDALMAVSTLVEVLGGEFLKYMDAFKPFLGIGLKNYAEYQVCLSAVGLVGDLCRALQSNILPFCDEVMQLLLENLGNENVHRSVKPQILSVFGDIALAIGGEFKKYLDVVLNTLQQASQAQVDKSDYDMVDYLNELREGCLEAYTGIIQGLKGDQENVHPDVMLVQPRVEFILSYIDHIAGDEDHTDGVVACAAGLIGDLCTAFGKDVLKLVEARPMIHELLTEGRRSKTNKTKTLATWATKELRKLKNQA
ncbi:importin subunit beta-1 [Chamaea fasciata]|uniref:importin subunit beta-1 n=1 Tax=Chamaea fasciata TaxID=190680 RepID=UPI00336A494D